MKIKVNGGGETRVGRVSRKTGKWYVGLFSKHGGCFRESEAAPALRKVESLKEANLYILSFVTDKWDHLNDVHLDVSYDINKTTGEVSRIWIHFDKHKNISGPLKSAVIYSEHGARESCLDRRFFLAHSPVRRR
jgi:hypothetical protein